MNVINTENDSFCEYYNASSLSLSHQRGLVLHLLYSLEMNEYEISVSELFFYYNIDFGIIVDSTDHIRYIIENITINKENIDQEIFPFLKNWQFTRLSILVKLILRYAIWELKEKKNDPILIINEAIELTKGYAEKDSYRFVNGILDAWSKNFLLNKA